MSKSPPLDTNAGRIVFEADSQGHLRRVDAPTVKGDARPRLWKPEPSLLLDHAAALKLDARQRGRIEAQNAAWQMEKARLEQEISRAASVATGSGQAMAGRNLSATQITENLNVYSRLSRQYDERRSDYWRQALSVLTAEQQETLAKTGESIRRTKRR